MNLDQYQREPVYQSDDSGITNQLADFIQWSGNSHFRISTWTWFSLSFILILYPYISIAFIDDPTSLLKNLDKFMRMVLLVSTIVSQWLFFSIVLIAIYREQREVVPLGITISAQSSWAELKAQIAQGMKSIGLGKLRGIYFAYGLSFLIAANLILTGIAWLLARIGLPMPGEIAMLIPNDPAGMVVWVVVSFTAGFCEEAMFRGYLMTRLKLVFDIKGWMIPVIVSAVVFGACHAYQGWPGFIILTIYGAMFSLLYIRTRSLWPCVIAHFFQDAGALFFPQ